MRRSPISSTLASVTPRCVAAGLTPCCRPARPRTRIGTRWPHLRPGNERKGGIRPWGRLRGRGGMSRTGGFLLREARREAGYSHTVSRPISFLHRGAVPDCRGGPNIASKPLERPISASPRRKPPLARAQTALVPYDPPQTDARQQAPRSARRHLHSLTGGLLGRQDGSHDEMRGSNGDDSLPCQILRPRPNAARFGGGCAAAVDVSLRRLR